jgi:hypothetical protein
MPRPRPAIQGIELALEYLPLRNNPGLSSRSRQPQEAIAHAVGHQPRRRRPVRQNLAAYAMNGDPRTAVGQP